MLLTLNFVIDIWYHYPSPVTLLAQCFSTLKNKTLQKCHPKTWAVPGNNCSFFVDSRLEILIVHAQHERLNPWILFNPHVEDESNITSYASKHFTVKQ